jgi:hypothetical protein
MAVMDITQAGRDRARRRFRRRLAAIDRALAKETPRLASMFAMFNQLAAEEPVGTERLPSRAWPRPGLAQFAFLATLAAIVALSVVLSTQVHSVMRPCLTSASATPAASSSASSSASPFASSPFASPFASSSASSSASPFASSSASPAAGQAGGAAGLAAFVPVRGLSCQAYAAPNK